MIQNIRKPRPIVRKWVLLLALSPVLLLLIFIFGTGPLFRYLGLTERALYIDFIDLSIHNPKDKKTGIELVSIGDGEATVRKREKTWNLKENGWGGHSGVRLLYASKENGEIVLERRHAGSGLQVKRHIKQHIDDFLGRKEKTMSANEILEKNSWMFVSLSTNPLWSATGPVETNFGIELVSVETNCATIRLSESGKVLCSRNGGFFDIKNSIKGADRLQLVNSSTKDKAALLRVIRDRNRR